MSSVSVTSNGFPTRQFGLYRNIDLKTEEFLKSSRKRQIRQGCACAAISTAVTVSVVVSIIIVYEYNSMLKMNAKPIIPKINGRTSLNKEDFKDNFQEKLSFDNSPDIILPKLLKAVLKPGHSKKAIKHLKSTTKPERKDIANIIFNQTKRNFKIPVSKLYTTGLKTQSAKGLDYIRRLRERKKNIVLTYLNKIDTDDSTNNNKSIVQPEYPIKKIDSNIDSRPNYDVLLPRASRIDRLEEPVTEEKEKCICEHEIAHLLKKLLRMLNNVCHKNCTHFCVNEAKDIMSYNLRSNIYNVNNETIPKPNYLKLNSSYVSKDSKKNNLFIFDNGLIQKTMPLRRKTEGHLSNNSFFINPSKHSKKIFEYKTSTGFNVDFTTLAPKATLPVKDPTFDKNRSEALKLVLTEPVITTQKNGLSKLISTEGVKNMKLDSNNSKEIALNSVDQSKTEFLNKNKMILSVTSEKSKILAIEDVNKNNFSFTKYKDPIDGIDDTEMKRLAANKMSRRVTKIKNNTKHLSNTYYIPNEEIDINKYFSKILNYSHLITHNESMKVNTKQLQHNKNEKTQKPIPQARLTVKSNLTNNIKFNDNKSNSKTNANLNFDLMKLYSHIEDNSKDINDKTKGVSTKNDEEYKYINYAASVLGKQEDYPVSQDFQPQLFKTIPTTNENRHIQRNKDVTNHVKDFNVFDLLNM